MPKGASPSDARPGLTFWAVLPQFFNKLFKQRVLGSARVSRVEGCYFMVLQSRFLVQVFGE